MIDVMNNSPNCCDINGWMESKLDLTDKQISFMQSSLDSLINLHGKPYGARYRHRTDGDPAPKPATHLEMRALNGFIASVGYKNVNYQQISNVEFLLNALQSEIDSLSAALAAHHQLENCHGVDVLEIYRSLQIRPSNGKISNAFTASSLQSNSIDLMGAFKPLFR